MLVLFAAAASAVLLAAYGVRVAVRGRYEHERARKEPGSFFLGRFLIEFGYWCFSPLERAALSLGVTPNQLTSASLACSIAGAAAFAVGKPDGPSFAATGRTLHDAHGRRACFEGREPSRATARRRNP